MVEKSSEKVELALPLKFWGVVLTTLDRKVQHLGNVYGYGKVGMTILVSNGKVDKVVFSDDMSLKWDEKLIIEKGT